MRTFSRKYFFFFKTNIAVFVCSKMLVKSENISVDHKTLYKIL